MEGFTSTEMTNLENKALAALGKPGLTNRQRGSLNKLALACAGVRAELVPLEARKQIADAKSNAASSLPFGAQPNT